MAMGAARAAHAVAMLAVVTIIGVEGSLFGPGLGPWALSDPALVGLSKAALRRAAVQVGSTGTQLCVAVAKKGALVLDERYGFGRGTDDAGGGAGRPIEDYSAGKTATAALFGVARTRGLFGLDVPLQQYGVAPMGADWSDNENGTDYYPRITARHLLTQTSGVGRYPPGQNFTYDSNMYIAHLSFLLNATATKHDGLSARAWATKYFAEPLGLPNMYAYQQADPARKGDVPEIDPEHQICPGADQPLSCADFARVGQLLLNNGTWLNSAGKPFTMIDPEYMHEMFTAGLAGRGIVGEGHMTDQYTLLSYLLDSNAPIAGPACSEATSGIVVVPGLPNGTLLALGALGRFMLVVPSLELVVVSFSSNAASVSCDKRAPRPGATWANRASPLLAALWSALGSAVVPSATQGLKETQEASSPTASRAPTAIEKVRAAELPQPPDDGYGACYCYCGVGQGIGRCFENTTNHQCVASVNRSAAITAYCPNVSEVIDCSDAEYSARACHNNLDNSLRLDPARSSNCSGAASATVALTEVRTCTYYPVEYRQCYWVHRAPCHNNPFFPA